jgi:hypothetical protein
MNRNRVRKILALDVRSQRFGYVVVEGARVCALDCGVRSVHRRIGYISDLLRLYRPSAVVLRRLKTDGRRDSPGARKIMRVIRYESRRLGVPVEMVSDTTLKRFFREHGKQTKHEVAQLLAACFPELRWRLPPVRKCYEREARRMSIFDAAQLGVVFLALQTGGQSVRKLLVDR